MQDFSSGKIYNGIDFKPIEDENFKSVHVDPASGKNMAEDIAKQFVDLVRSGEFTKAMVLVHGHDRFGWFYELFDRVSRRYSAMKLAKLTAKTERAGHPSREVSGGVILGTSPD